MAQVVNLLICYFIFALFAVLEVIHQNLSSSQPIQVRQQVLLQNTCNDFNCGRYSVKLELDLKCPTTLVGELNLDFCQ